MKKKSSRQVIAKKSGSQKVATTKRATKKSAKAAQKTPPKKRPAAKAKVRHFPASQRKGRKKLAGRSASSPSIAVDQPTFSGTPVEVQQPVADQEYPVLGREYPVEAQPLPDSPATEQPLPAYELRENLLDPGWIIYSEIAHEMRRQLAAAHEAQLRIALDHWLEQMHGPPRSEILPRVCLVFAGPVGSVIPAACQFCDRAGTLEARAVFTQPLQLQRIHQVKGTFAGCEQPLDLTSLLRDGETELGDWQAYELQALEICLSQPATDDGAPLLPFPGLLWDLPAELSRRISAIELHGQGCGSLTWQTDSAGRLFIEPQAVPVPATFVPSEDGVEMRYSAVIRLRIAPGELRHCRPLLLNAAEYTIWQEELLREHAAVPAGTICEATLNLAGIQVQQVLAGTPGRTGEDRDLWFARVSQAQRHRGRAITAADFLALVQDFCPEAHVLEVAATQAQIDGEWQDAVRLLVWPRASESLTAALEQGVELAQKIRAFFVDKLPLGTHLLVGPPTLSVPRLPATAERLWVYRDYLVSTSSGLQSTTRADGHCWPVRAWADLENNHG